ncbi:rhodanese-like domain-containing protein [Coleofasciculus sp.]|uniref:rhodanese-like domain-containing protein n=1 Tax=Coleofasciculus sp. TaxID=3100458 RepID=UPI0040641EB5
MNKQLYQGKIMMKSKKMISGLLLVLLLVLTLFSGVFFPKSALAAVESKVTSPPSAEVYTAVDQLLNSLPRDYYTVRRVKQLKNQLKKPNNVVLVDVREPSEYASGHIPGAINVPVRSLTKNLDKIPTDKPVVLYCSSGHRTAIGMTALRLLGYTNVRSFPPSINGWKEAGEPLEK